MNADAIVPLTRRFTPVDRDLDTREENFIKDLWGLTSPTTWLNLRKEYRTVIIADAGAGKTFEMKNQTRLMNIEGLPAFFIRIEDIDGDFTNAFEIGNHAGFSSWLQAATDAWFFLDSVDEARLENPTAFEKAVKIFAQEIQLAAHRAHICISTRPYAWRAKTDSALIDQVLSLPKTKKEAPETDDENQLSRESIGNNEDGVKIYWLSPLDKADIHTYAQHRSAPDVDDLMEAIARANLWNLAERPFDLDDLLTYWGKNYRFGSRLDMLTVGITRRLREIEEDREQLQPLQLEKALAGARALAAAVTLCKESGIRVSDGMKNTAGIDVETVLGWEKKDLNALLSRGIFNDLIYGVARFRHREIRELLTAQWLHEMLKNGGSRQAIESLIFKNQYGEDVITPTMRPVLPWLIVFDKGIRKRALAIHPEIAVEGGDVSGLRVYERRKILEDIVVRIAKNEDNQSARDNAAIARIAQQDLSADTLQLIEKYHDNDDAIFFLGRLVWQGSMTQCVESFYPIALDSNRGIYARIASARAITTLGSREQAHSLWRSLISLEQELPRELLVELVTDAAADIDSVNLLLPSLGKLLPYDRFKVSGLREVMNSFIDRLPTVSNTAEENPLLRLAIGLNEYLDQKPHIAQRECAVSEKYSWLMGPAMHNVERLIEARSNLCFSTEAIDIMQKVPALRDWRGEDFSENKSRLAELVPQWPELNDALYWQCIASARAWLEHSKDQRLTDDWRIAWRGHFWQFDDSSFESVLGYIRDRPLLDDRLVALNLAFRLFHDNDRPAEWLSAMEQAAGDHEELATTLHQLLNPAVSEKREELLREQTRYKRRRERENWLNKERRNRFASLLRSNPELIRNPPGLIPGRMSDEQLRLMNFIEEDGLQTDRRGGSHWRILIPEFGNDVAEVYRDAARLHWRAYTPDLRSEGANTKSIPWDLIFAMSGLEIEHQEAENFPENLSEDEATLAFRYITWELNGLPLWMEALYEHFPALGMEAIWCELVWELNNTPANEPLHYILDDLAYHAPWLHAELAIKIHDWLHNNKPTNKKCLNHCLHIMINGQLSTTQLRNLAEEKIEKNTAIDYQPTWFALWVDTDPDIAIPTLAATLSTMAQSSASAFTQSFVVALVGERRGLSASVGDYRTAKHLKALYTLAHQHIRSDDDIEREVTPKLREDAQDARTRLFTLLMEIPGKDTYLALKELANDLPSPTHRHWMTVKARSHAIRDADLEPWQPEQIREFSERQEMTPSTHRQLFELGVSRLIDFKNWLEGGHDSLAATYQKAKDEGEMRNIVAHWLNGKASNRYDCAQEPELANAQRPDIWLQHSQVAISVPIELKLLDKDWSGPDLCVSLEKQLAGDYLRDANAGCGIFLLVWQGKQIGKHWEIDGQRYAVAELQTALETYWEAIASRFANVVAIKIICIDLTLRAIKSTRK